MSDPLTGFQALETIVDHAEWVLSRVADPRERESARIAAAHKIRGERPTSESQELRAARLEGVRLSKGEAR